MCDCVRLVCLVGQGLRKAEGTSEKMEHLVKTRNQSIQRLQQEIAVSLCP